MAYFEIRPTETSLNAFVECFWVYQPSAIQSSTQRIIPDGCVDILYFLPRFQQTTNERSRTKKIAPTIVGTMTQPRLTQLHPTHDYLGIRFRPGGIAAFIHLPLYTLTDRVCLVDEMHPSLGTTVQHQLEKVTGWFDQIQLLETALLKTLRPATYQIGLVAPVIEQLLTAKGQVPISELSRQVTTASPRHLERLFHHCIGVSPKVLARIIRFRHIRSILDAHPDDSLMSIAFDNGYTDHAHLTKEFIAFTGLTPSVYRGQ